MITAVDTNVLLDVFLADPDYGERAAGALRRGLQEGVLLISDVVLAELCSVFDETATALGTLEQIDIRFEATTRAAAVHAGELWRRYRQRRGQRKRIVADFLIGAHALHQADRLLTRDRGFYRDHFDGLDVLEP